MGTLALTAWGVGHISVNGAAQAVRLANGTVFFEQVPVLVKASITQQSVSDSNVGYYFDLSVPSDAGEALKRIEITQQDAGVFTRTVEFELDESAAFVGRRGDRAATIPIGQVELDEENHTVSLTFEPPVPAGTDLTLRLEAERNPRRSGIYLFGVTAYPDGEPSHGQFLGFGRFHIYDNDRDGSIIFR